MKVQFFNHPKICYEYRNHGHLLNGASIFKGVNSCDFSELITPLKGAVKLHGEIHMLLFRPIFADTMPDNHVVRSRLDAVVDQFVTMLQINDKCHGIRRLQSIAVNSNSWSGRQFCLNAVILQLNTVMPSMSSFCVFLKSALVFVPPAFAFPEFGARHDQDVPIVAHSGSLKVGVRKSKNHAVSVVISATTIPSFKSCVGTQLHHAKRRCSTRIRMSVTTGADPGIDLQVQRRGRVAASVQEQDCGNEYNRCI